MKKLIVSDLDGTLLPYGSEKISEKILIRIKSILKRGGEFAIASGRSYTELKQLLGDIADKVYIIADDGAYTVKAGKVVYSRPIPFPELNCFVRECESCVLHTAFGSFTVGIPPASIIPEDAQQKSPSALIWDEVYKITAVGAPDEATEKYKLRKHSFDGAEEFVLAYANKGSAVSDLQLRLGLFTYDTYVIGDGGNDIPMARVSAKSFAVGNSKFAEKATDKVSDPCKALDIILSLI